MRSMLVALVLLTADAPPAPPPPEEDSGAIVARLLVDACTDEPTTDLLVMQTTWTLQHCNWPLAICMRRACAALQRCPKGLQVASR